MVLDVASSIVSGTIFNHFFDKRVDTCEKAAKKIGEAFQGHGQSLIGSAASAIKTRQIEVFNDVQTLIENFKVIYSGEMNETVEKVGKTARELLAQIDSIVYRCINGLGDMQEELYEVKALGSALISTMREKTLFNTLSNRPLLWETFPKCVAPVQGVASVAIRCVGFFPEADNPELAPLLELGGKKFKHVSNGGHITFSVPSSLLFSDDKSMGVIGFTVRIPYVVKGWIYNESLYSEYRRLLSLLPEFPGKISLEYVTAHMEEKEKRDIQATICQNSKKQKHGGEHCNIINRPHVLSAPSGWSIVPGSGHLHVHCNEGKGNSWTGVTEGPTQVHFHASTHKHRHGRDCGNLVIGLKAEMVQYHEVFKTTVKELPLSWGESQALDTSHWKNWKVIFEPFDGSKREYTGNVEGRYISIQSPNGMPIISVKRFDQVSGSRAVPEPMLARL